MHIPADERAEIPVIADDFGVIGVCGFAVSQRVAMNDKTQKCFNFKYPYGGFIE
ncbi:MAG: hypothetical protein L6V88_04365 [Anaerotruncus sp.]|nr:MAG: hypothetical protein L6V88_04365 [Anaerotruncus sp.]